MRPGPAAQVSLDSNTYLVGILARPPKSAGGPPPPPPQSPPPVVPPPQSPPPVVPPSPPPPSTPPVVPPPQSPPPPGPGGAGCRAQVTVGGTWPTGNAAAPYAATVGISLSTTGQATPVPYTVVVRSAGGYAGDQGHWNVGSWSVASGAATGVLSEAWQALAAGGQAATFGANLVSASSNLAPTSVTVNGVPCALSTS